MIPGMVPITAAPKVSEAMFERARARYLAVALANKIGGSPERLLEIAAEFVKREMEMDL